ncbi:hypothetical protein [Homoserinimonas aerilata]|uniref:hypothetical protein n=1 Tax=Homoserinimonas aerilata TaxID=1162970 RepID=UPI001FEA170B|nr:hypothetical protein [Homoserinimonas aerilata]
MTRFVSETITPRGVLLIDGWKPHDKLDVATLGPTLSLLGKRQSHLFSAGDWRADPFIVSLVDDGLLVLHEAPLDDVLRDLAEAGALRSDDASPGADHVIALGDGFVSVDVNTWNQIRRSARPVDLELLTPPVFSSTAAKYQEFRNFVGATEGAPRWSGLAARMHLRRDFEAEVLDHALKQVQSRELPAPIVVEGQTATGKSIGLASIALELSRSGRVAVLHQARRTVRPAVEDVDMYAAWAEDHGAEATVLVWDGMTNPAEYEALSRQLRARGRRVLIIGTTYKKQAAPSSTIFTAAAELSPGEVSRLIDLLTSFGVEIRRPKNALDTSFLAFLYYTLPETERQLRSGLAREMRAAELAISELAREQNEKPSSQQRLTAMQAALQAAGIDLEELLPQSNSDKPVAAQSFAERAPLQRITALVLVAGKHGVPVPIDLALRVLGREGSQSVRDALNSSDIIREINDDNGEIFLAARSHLEAELLAQHEVPVTVEIEVIAEAIRNIRILDGFGGGADEVQFLVSLFERIGPAADLPRYRMHFGEIADALRERRHELGSPRPRLALQESNFVRGYVQWQQDAHEGSLASRVSALEYNAELLDEVLSSASTKGLIRLSLSVELASTLGAIIYEYSHGENGETIEGLAGRLDDVLGAVLDARAVDPGNTYPVDVLAWSTLEAIGTGAMRPDERLDRLAYAVATLESLDRSTLSEAQLAKLDSRGVSLNKALADDAAVWSYLQNLETNTSPAATYFLAQSEAKNVPNGERQALSRLRAAPAQTRKDWRCAQLLVDLTWRDIAGARLLSGERLPLHLSPADLAQIASLSADLQGAELPDLYRLRFIQAVAQFSKGNYAESGKLFREVGDLTRQLSKRIYTSYFLADENQVPRVFTGRVEFADARSGEVWVNELGTRIKFEPRLFSATGDFARSQQLPAFLVGFKLSRGPVAEPRSIYRSRSHA